MRIYICFQRRNAAATLFIEAILLCAVLLEQLYI